jgi:hypothetical protein
MKDQPAITHGGIIERKQTGYGWEVKVEKGPAKARRTMKYWGNEDTYADAIKNAAEAELNASTIIIQAQLRDHDGVDE